MTISTGSVRAPIAGHSTPGADVTPNYYYSNTATPAYHSRRDLLKIAFGLAAASVLPACGGGGSATITVGEEPTPVPDPAPALNLSDVGYSIVFIQPGHPEFNPVFGPGFHIQMAARNNASVHKPLIVAASESEGSVISSGFNLLALSANGETLLELTSRMIPFNGNPLFGMFIPVSAIPSSHLGQDIRWLSIEGGNYQVAGVGGPTSGQVGTVLMNVNPFLTQSRWTYATPDGTQLTVFMTQNPDGTYPAPQPGTF